MSPEESVAVSRHQSVPPIAKSSRQEIQQCRPESPETAQFPKHSRGCIVSGEKVFGGESAIQNQVNRVQPIWIQSMAFENGAGELALQGSESKLTLVIAL
jgi:hypothetical protein